MALELVGELLSVTTIHYDARTTPDGENWAAQDVTDFLVFDGHPVGGRVTQVRMGRDFPGNQYRELRAALDAGQRPQVRLDVFSSSKGRVFANSVVEAVTG